MASLLDTIVTANYLKTSPSSLFGTRSFRFLDIKVSGAGIGLVDFTKQKVASTDGVNYDTTTGVYSDSNSWFAGAVRALQTVAEVYLIGIPDADEFVVIVADQTADGAEANSNVQATTFGKAEAVIKAAIESQIAGGTIANPTKPTVTVTITSATNFTGGALSFA